MRTALLDGRHISSDLQNIGAAQDAVKTYFIIISRFFILLKWMIE